MSLRVSPQVVLTALGTVALLLLTLLPATGPAAAASKGRLSVGPTVHVPGQKLTFSGSLGVRGVRPIKLQQHLSRPGDSWADRTGVVARTKRDGSFSFTYPAPAMKELRLRVASGKHTTPAWTASPKAQDLTVRLLEVPGLETGRVLAGVPFTLLVDTTPTFPHRPDLPGPAFRGREITLQRQKENLRWETVANGTTNGQGRIGFVQSLNDPGTAIYRVRQEDYRDNGHRIGWFPSFPIAVEAVRILGTLTSTDRTDRSEPAPLPRVRVKEAKDNRRNPMAGQTFGWGPTLWDFDWIAGESLSSPPLRGTKQKGRWRDTTTGLGRVSLHNGQIELDTQRLGRGPGDFGTTTATLEGNARKYGRWETRLRINRWETGARDYRARIELVPERAKDYRCGAQNITVADIKVGSAKVGLGVRARNGKEWRRTQKFSIGVYPATFAVQVTKKHITWFINATPVGTVRRKAAVSDVPMTLRLSLVGDGQAEMNHTQLFADWVRGWSLDRGKKISRGPKLKARSDSVSC